MARRRRSNSDNSGCGCLLGAAIFLSCVATAWYEWDAGNLKGVWVPAGIAVLVLVVLVAWANQRAKVASSLNEFLKMSPSEFEAAVGRVLQAAGYKSIKQVGGAGDLALDLVGKDQVGRPVLVQCKRYAAGNLVGSPAI